MTADIEFGFATTAVDAPGMIYAGPIVHGGKLYVATCNLDGPNNTKPRVFVCLGAP